MIEIEKLKLNADNKKILTDYKFFLIHEEHLEEKTTCESYLYDTYKYLSFIEKRNINNYLKISRYDIYEYLKYLDDEEYSIYSEIFIK